MEIRYYRPELDALRCFAFLAVFLGHLTIIKARWYQPIMEAGGFGMCIFFMLSAYLIINILMREKDTTGNVNLRSFALRRILRIWPLYFVVLFLAYAAGRYYHGSLTLSAGAVLAFSLLAGNLYILHNGWLGPVSVLWSLSVEEQFYLAVPAIVRLGGRRGIIAFGVAAISFAYVVLLRLGFNGASGRAVWVDSFVQFQFFAAGGLMALALHRRALLFSLSQRAALAILGLALWIGSAKLFETMPLRMRPLPVVGAFALMMLGSVTIFISILDIQLRIPRPLIYLGKISYGLYLFHVFFIWVIFHTSDRFPQMLYFENHKQIGIPLAFGLTVASAAFSYHFFERPILKFKERFETIHTRPAENGTAAILIARGIKDSAPLILPS
jgi:peptidoglycan/LPS O-acetylase OafA/YrhL